MPVGDDLNSMTAGAKGLGLDVRKVEQLASMSQEERVKATA